MKRKDLLRYLMKHGCRLYREGGNHSVYINPVTKMCTAVPKHSEIKKWTAKAICKQLGIA